MSPDLNSLPASRSSPPSTPSSIADRPRRISFNNTDNFLPSPPSPRSPSLASLQASASINAGLHRTSFGASPARNGMERRRSSLLNNISLNDQTQSTPGELQQRDGSNLSSPRAGRRSFVSHETPRERNISLGDLHQELENEQEAQVNRLLYMIRLQQDQLAALSRENSQDTALISPSEQHGPASSAAVTDPSLRATPSSTSAAQVGPQSLSRQSSSRFSTAGTSSHGVSPALRPVSASLGPLTGDFSLGGARDEAAFYHAETQMLTRENQMLKHRIRELERQVTDMAGSSVHHPSTQPLRASPRSTAAGHDAHTSTTLTDSQTKD